ncbi:hypothetical protein Pmani_031348, partial [Petrolisthes manimaculis]
MEVEGLVGGGAALPCDVSHPEGDQLLLLLWFKGSLTTPIF